MVPVDAGDRIWGNIGKEGRAANVGGDGIADNFVAPRVLQSSNALNGDVETPGESHVPVRMAARHIDPTEETVGDLAGNGFVAGCEENAGFDAANDGYM